VVHVSCILGDLAPTDPPVTITITATVAANFPAELLTNTATVSSGTTDPLPGGNTDSWPSDVTSSAGLSITKTGSDTVAAGGPIAWVVTVSNAGPSDARAVTMTDEIPAGVTDVIATPSVGTCDVTVVCQLGTVAAGASVTIDIGGKVRPDFDDDLLTNVATTRSPDEALGATPDQVDTEVSRSADVSITKTLTAGGTQAGAPVSWTIVVGNAGPSTADEVVVTDAVPSAVLGATATTSAGSCSFAGTTMTCALGTVDPGGPVSITVGGTVDPAFRGTLANTASVASSTTDPDPSNLTAAVSSTVGGTIDLTIAKSVDRPEGLLGSTATFTVSASNLGPSSASDVVVDEQLPDGLTFVAARPSIGTFDATTRRWSIGTLAPGVQATMAVDVTLAAVGTQTAVSRIGQTANPAVLALTPTGDDETRSDNNTVSASIVVTQPVVDLPATGLDAWRVVELALATVVVGGALVLLVRRRRLRTS